MKKILLVLTACLSLSLVKAQIENIKIIGDSTVIINKAYAGLLAKSIFSQDSLSFAKSTNIRIGFEATYNLLRELSITSRGIYQSESQEPISSNNQFWATYKLQAFSLETGFLPSLATETKPVPISPDGQFETWTEKTIPGVALGAKIKYNFKTNYLGAGIADRNKKPEYHLRFFSPHFRASVYYGQYRETFGSTLAIKTKNLYNIMALNINAGTANQEMSKTLGNFFCLVLDSEIKLECYSDLGYDLKNGRFAKIDFGLLKKFSSNFLKGLFQLGYSREKLLACPATKVIEASLFIYI